MEKKVMKSSVSFNKLSRVKQLTIGQFDMLLLLLIFLSRVDCFLLKGYAFIVVVLTFNGQESECDNWILMK